MFGVYDPFFMELGLYLASLLYGHHYPVRVQEERRDGE